MPSSGANLTQVTYIGRQVVKFGAVLVVVLLVGRTSMNAFIAFWKAAHPPPPPPPTVGFGALPRLRFPERADIIKPTSYSLELPRGSLPVFGDRAKVFLMPPTSLSLLADGRAKSVASAYNFVFEPQILNTRVYRWTKSQPIESSLQIDIQTIQLKLSTDYLSRPSLLIKNELPDEFSAVERVKKFLERSNSLGDDVATASGEVVFLKSLGGETAEAVSYSDADFIQVDLNRNPIDNQFRMFTPKGYQGTTRAIVIGSVKDNQGIVYLEHNYHPVDYLQVHTYPLRSAQSAWQLVKAGEAYIPDPGKTDSAVIRSVTLAYYDDFEEQAYLQPIYVFKGDGGFLAYVSALDPSVVQSSGGI